MTLATAPQTHGRPALLTWTWTLPLLALFCWPTALGPAATLAPFAVGLLAVALVGLAWRPSAPSAPLTWLAGVVALAWLGSGTDLLSSTALLAAAAAAAVLMAMGGLASQQPRITRALVTATVLAMVFHVAVAWLQFFGLGPALGDFRPSNLFGMFTVFGLAGVWWRYRNGLDPKPATAALALLACSGMALSGSRTGVLEVLAFAVCLMFWAERRQRFEWAVFVAAPLWVWLLDTGLHALAPLTSMPPGALPQPGTLSVRPNHWAEAWQLALKHPLWGAGWGALGHARFEEPGLAASPVNALLAHNPVLHVFGEFGFFGGALFLTPLCLLLWRLRPWAASRSREPGHPISRRWGWLVLVTVGLHSLTEYPLWYMAVIVPTAFVFGLLMADLPQQPRHTVSSRTVLALSAALLLTTTLTLAGRHRVIGARAPEAADAAPGGQRSVRLARARPAAVPAPAPVSVSVSVSVSAPRPVTALP